MTFALGIFARLLWCLKKKKVAIPCDIFVRFQKFICVLAV